MLDLGKLYHEPQRELSLPWESSLQNELSNYERIPTFSPIDFLAHFQKRNTLFIGDSTGIILRHEQ
jgi:hypothetical protein